MTPGEQDLITNIEKELDNEFEEPSIDLKIHLSSFLGRNDGGKFGSYSKEFLDHEVIEKLLNKLKVRDEEEP